VKNVVKKRGPLDAVCKLSNIKGRVKNRYKISIESRPISFTEFIVTDSPFDSSKLVVSLEKGLKEMCIGEVQYDRKSLNNMEKGDVALDYSLDNRVTVKEMSSSPSSGSSKAKPRSLDEGKTVCYTTVKKIISNLK